MPPDLRTRYPPPRGQNRGGSQLFEGAIVVASLAVHDGGLLRKHVRAPAEEAHRRQLRPVGPPTSGRADAAQDSCRGVLHHLPTVQRVPVEGNERLVVAVAVGERAPWLLLERVAQVMPLCATRRISRHLPVCGGAAGSCTVTRSPPAARGVRVRVPSCAWVMLLTIARPRPSPAWSVRMRSVPR
ncbi:MAG: hypothetical protein JWO17_387 [Actinomycetia bacterium]|nr:hypothetical protein [Actinomycetes bacterium]